MDRATGFYPVGCGFESCLGCHFMEYQGMVAEHNPCPVVSDTELERYMHCSHQLGEKEFRSVMAGGVQRTQEAQYCVLCGVRITRLSQI